MAVKKRENGSLTGSKRYAAEKGKSVEEQTQDNHAKAMHNVKEKFQKPLESVTDGIKAVSQGIQGVERATITIKNAVSGGSSTVTDTHTASLAKASGMATQYGVAEIDVTDLLGKDPYQADGNIPEMTAADANRQKLKIQRQNNALEVRHEKIKQGRKVFAIASEQRRLIGDVVDFATAGIETATKVVKNQIADTRYQTEQSKLEQTEELLYQQRVATQGTLNLTHGIEQEWDLKFQNQQAKNDRLKLEIEGSQRENEMKRLEIEARLFDS
ncbi:MAG: hypothetical protein KME22_09300 [Hassallia sp. WJT32-NPBG1]|jgi:hypothetical protein|nr:hypothetical protein [Hassallia sp. WJT32-NPBG1]